MTNVCFVMLPITVNPKQHIKHTWSQSEAFKKICVTKIVEKKGRFAF